jgi:Putative prokaryotic signal transducing protein
MDEAKLVIVQDFTSEPEATVAKSALDAAGIDAMIQADTAGHMRTHIAWSGAGFRLLVREEDAAAAREILESPTQDVDDGAEESPS